MRSRTLLFFVLAALLGAAVAVLPALAVAPSEVKLEVNENCVQPDWPCWTTEGSAPKPKPTQTVTIAVGGTVAFVDHGEQANIAWTGPAPACEPSVPVAPATPKTGWEGKCTFPTSGTYKFESATMFHDAYEDYRHYEVVVEGSTTTPPTGEGGSKGSSPPGTTTSAPTPGGESQTGSPLSGTKINSSQRGTTVKGSVQISKAGAGDRLEVDLLATIASLAKAGHATTQTVGRFVTASVSTGQRPFSVKLDARARRALKRHHLLALKVKITLAPVYGQPTTTTRSVTLHA
jgi:hypothetical protein